MIMTIETTKGKYFHQRGNDTDDKQINFYHSGLEDTGQVDLRCHFVDENLKLIHKDSPAMRLMFKPSEDKKYIEGDFIKVETSLSLLGDSIATECVQLIIEDVGLISLVPLSDLQNTLAGYTSIQELSQKGMWQAYSTKLDQGNHYILFHTIEKGEKIFCIKDILDLLAIPVDKRKISGIAIGFYLLKGAAAMMVKDVLGSPQSLLSYRTDLSHAISVIESLIEITDAERISILEVLKSK
jgi:hypothetical protein